MCVDFLCSLLTACGAPNLFPRGFPPLQPRSRALTFRLNLNIHVLVKGVVNRRNSGQGCIFFRSNPPPGGKHIDFWYFFFWGGNVKLDIKRQFFNTVNLKIDLLSLKSFIFPNLANKTLKNNFKGGIFLENIYSWYGVKISKN